MNVIIQSPYKGKRNWSGKEFSSLPAKVYTSFDDAIAALNSYCFFQYDKDKGTYIEVPDEQKIKEIRIIHLTEKRQQKLLNAGTIRF